MDRNFLYGIATFLAISLCGVYVQKNNPNFFSEIVGDKPTVEPWQEEAGPLKDDSAQIVPPPIDVEPKEEPQVEPSIPEELEPETEPEQRQLKRRLRDRRNQNQDDSCNP
jgi:hypothetical protein